MKQANNKNSYNMHKSVKKKKKKKKKKNQKELSIVELDPTTRHAEPVPCHGTFAESCR